jgi:hypothetical protein
MYGPHMIMYAYGAVDKVPFGHFCDKQAFLDLKCLSLVVADLVVTVVTDRCFV